MLNRLKYKLKTKLYNLIFGKLELVETETLPKDVQVTVSHLDGTRDVIWTKAKRNVYKRKRHSELESGGAYAQVDNAIPADVPCCIQYEIAPLQSEGNDLE